MAPTPCETAEKDIGLEFYHSDSHGTGGRIKAHAEDFEVDEISDLPPAKEGGRYTIAKVTTRNWEMNRLIKQLAGALRISRQRIGFAGTKDKRAITSQLMSFEMPPEALDSIELNDIWVSDVYQAARPIKIGDLIGNRFSVHVRECELQGDELSSALEHCKESLDSIGGFPNYFGVQRFGVARPITHLVGKSIVAGDFKQAVLTYLAHPSEYESPESKACRLELQQPDGRDDLLAEFPRGMNFERTLVEYLARRPEDYAGALRQLPDNLQMMFVHAYQSYIFNRILSERMRRGMPLHEPIEGDLVLTIGDKRVPIHERPIEVTSANMDLVADQVRAGKAFVSGLLFGSESRFAVGEMGEIERKAVEDEGLEPEDFVVPQIQRCSSRGSRREILCSYESLRADMAEDGYVLSFSLTKGNYATCLLREFMKADMKNY